MSGALIRVVCIRYWNFKQKIRLVNKYSSRGYRVEILSNEFVYAENKEYERRDLCESRVL